MVRDTDERIEDDRVAVLRVDLHKILDTPGHPWPYLIEVIPDLYTQVTYARSPRRTPLMDLPLGITLTPIDSLDTPNGFRFVTS